MKFENMKSSSKVVFWMKNPKGTGFFTRLPEDPGRIYFPDKYSEYPEIIEECITEVVKVKNVKDGHVGYIKYKPLDQGESVAESTYNDVDFCFNGWSKSVYRYLRIGGILVFEILDELHCIGTHTKGGLYTLVRGHLRPLIEMEKWPHPDDNSGYSYTGLRAMEAECKDKGLGIGYFRYAERLYDMACDPDNKVNFLIVDRDRKLNAQSKKLFNDIVNHLSNDIASGDGPCAVNQRISIEDNDSIAFNIAKLVIWGLRDTELVKKLQLDPNIRYRRYSIKDITDFLDGICDISFSSNYGLINILYSNMKLKESGKIGIIEMNAYNQAFFVDVVDKNKAIIKLGNLARVKKELNKDDTHNIMDPFVKFGTRTNQMYTYLVRMSDLIMENGIERFTRYHVGVIIDMVMMSGYMLVSPYEYINRTLYNLYDANKHGVCIYKDNLSQISLKTDLILINARELTSIKEIDMEKVKESVAKYNEEVSNIMKKRPDARSFMKQILYKRVITNTTIYD